MTKPQPWAERVQKVTPEEALQAFDGAADTIRKGCKAFAEQAATVGITPLSGLDVEVTRTLLVGHYGLGAEFGNGLNVVSQLDFMLPKDRSDGLLEMVHEPSQIAAHAKETKPRGRAAQAIMGQAGLSPDETKRSALETRVALMERWVGEQAGRLTEAQQEALQATVATLRGGVEALNDSVTKVLVANLAPDRPR